MILSDNETKVDLLNNEAIAKTIVSLIKDSKEQPISIGIHGDWGAGKSSILEMVENEVKTSATESGKKYACIRFNGWKHQGFEDSKVALMSSIISELEKKRKTWCEGWRNIKKTVGKYKLDERSQDCRKNSIGTCYRYSASYITIFNDGYFKSNGNHRRRNCWSN
ncbi:MAG: P-loop NTPase fold protein [Lachnospira sp.]